MRRSLFVFVALAVSAGASALIAGARAKVPSHTMDSAAVLAEARTRDLDIALYERRAAEDPESSADRGRLAGLYLQRGRETGSFADVQRAESLAVRALNLRESHNDEVFSVLAAARLALHDFSGALEAARSLVNRDPAEPYRRAVLGEVLLELGRYDEAAVIFRALERETSRLPVATRLARWYELTGRIGHARNVMRYALRRIVQEGRATREQEAWYHLRLGEIELKMGAVETAESLFVSGLARSPDDHRLLGARAVAAARRQDWLAAIDAGERAIAVHVDPATLGIVSEAYAALGDWAQSVSYARAMRASALAQPGPIHRAWGLFLLDHGDEAETVLARAREELETRRDVYGYDLVAWALHTLGRDDEAWPNVTRALAQGTEDALLWYHAAQVAQARGDSEAAQRFASRAVGINARFAERTQASPEARGQRLEARGREARGQRLEGQRLEGR